MRPVPYLPQEHVKMLRAKPLDFDLASNGHNAALETEEPVMTTRRIFLGSTLVAASAAALPHFAFGQSPARAATIKTRDGVEIFVKRGSKNVSHR
jgi:hypothetical protein